MRKNRADFNSRYLQSWPRLAELAQQPEQELYEVLSIARLEEAMTYGERSLVGQGVAIGRLDLALAGLWAELAEEFFHDNLFESRWQAVTEILLAAQTYLEPQGEAALPRSERVQLLFDEALSALQQWNHMLRQQEHEPLLYAAEEAEEKL